MTEEPRDTSSDSGTDAGFDGLSGEVARDPHPLYRLLRDATPPLRVVGPRGPTVLVGKRALLDEIFRRPDLYSSALHAGSLGNVRPLIPIEVDPPDQRKYRRILDPLFHPQRLQALEQPVARLVNDLIDGFADATHIDFAAQFSVPFPSQVFLTLFGLPLDELPRFLTMKDGIIRPFHVLDKPIGDPEVKEYQAAVAASVYDYFNGLLDERADKRSDDLLSQLLDAEMDGERLTREDILDTCFLFLIAGLDTVSASLDCFFARLAENPHERQQVAAGEVSAESVVEELLRWETPVMLVSRFATRDTELGGCPVKAGENVLAFIGAANLDDTEFFDADAVRFDRGVNRHIAFGSGIHRCLGSHLARLELRVALREWHARIPDYRIEPGAAVEFTPGGVRSVDAFPLLLAAPAKPGPAR